MNVTCPEKAETQTPEILWLHLYLLENDFRLTEQIQIIPHIMNEGNKLYDWLFEWVRFIKSLILLFPNKFLKILWMPACQLVIDFINVPDSYNSLD